VSTQHAFLAVKNALSDQLQARWRTNVQIAEQPVLLSRTSLRVDLRGLPGSATGPSTTAWSHDFLNKKPWHPLNFRNQIKRYEVEQAALKKEKVEAQAKAEFEAEQQYLDTLAHLPSQEADKYRHMQGARREWAVLVSVTVERQLTDAAHANGASCNGTALPFNCVSLTGLGWQSLAKQTPVSDTVE
jgi:hypothetical protein